MATTKIVRVLQEDGSFKVAVCPRCGTERWYALLEHEDGSRLWHCCECLTPATGGAEGAGRGG
jgi:hypothetical protein